MEDTRLVCPNFVKYKIKIFAGVKEFCYFCEWTGLKLFQLLNSDLFFRSMTSCSTTKVRKPRRTKLGQDVRS